MKVWLFLARFVLTKEIQAWRTWLNLGNSGIAEEVWEVRWQVRESESGDFQPKEMVLAQ